MLDMCRLFLSARRSLLLAGWDLHAGLPMVRGTDVRVDDEHDPVHQVPTASLGDAGLDADVVAFWSAGNLRVVDVLGFAVRRGVRVGVLLWDAFHQGSHLTNSPAAQCAILEAAGVECLLDDSSRTIRHLTQSLHQKCAVVDGKVAYVGGIDLTMQEGGDYDRWDTHRHACESPVRASHLGPAAHPWHDVHCRLEGPIVADVETNIVQRWNDVAVRHGVEQWPPTPAHVPDLVESRSMPTASSAPAATAQVIRTIPPGTYAFAPQGIATIKAGYLAALAQAKRFVYIENQYVWSEVFLGLDSLRWGAQSPDMAEIFDALGATLERGVYVAITLPDHPNCGRRFTDGGVEQLRRRAESAGTSDHLFVFTLGSSEDAGGAPGGVYYRPVYTHAKVAMVDDVWFTVGSANLNSRGMHSDAEINVAVVDADAAVDLRMTLWTEHLRRAPNQRHGLEDAVAGVRALNALAEANRERVRARRPLVGHILPYLTHADGVRLDLPVHSEHGWLDNLPGSAGATAQEYAGRYI
jgi:phosphatidylserine/phosphatidylglycerophosphate/cardiolipin synthase-like enzyme